MNWITLTMNQRVVIPKFYENVRIISGNGQYCYAPGEQAIVFYRSSSTIQLLSRVLGLGIVENSKGLRRLNKG